MFLIKKKRFLRTKACLKLLFPLASKLLNVATRSFWFGFFSHCFHWKATPKRSKTPCVWNLPGARLCDTFGFEAQCNNGWLDIFTSLQKRDRFAEWKIPKTKILGERCIKHADGSQLGGTSKKLESKFWGVQKAKNVVVNGNRTVKTPEWICQWHRRFWIQFSLKKKKEKTPC